MRQHFDHSDSYAGRPGEYAFSANIITMLMILGGLGTISASLQSLSIHIGDQNKRYGYSTYAYRFGLLATITVSLLFYLLTYFINFSIDGAGPMLRVFAWKPVFFICAVSDCGGTADQSSKQIFCPVQYLPSHIGYGGFIRRRITRRGYMARGWGSIYATAFP